MFSFLVMSLVLGTFFFIAQIKLFWYHQKKEEGEEYSKVAAILWGFSSMVSLFGWMGFSIWLAIKNL